MSTRIALILVAGIAAFGCLLIVGIALAILGGSGMQPTPPVTDPPNPVVTGPEVIPFEDPSDDRVAKYLKAIESDPQSEQWGLFDGEMHCWRWDSKEITRSDRQIRCQHAHGTITLKSGNPGKYWMTFKPR